MTSPNATPTPITPPRVPLIDERTGLIDRAWYMFFLSLFQTAVDSEDVKKGPDANSALATYDALLRAVQQAAETQRPDQTQEIQQAVDALRQELQTLPRPELGTFAALQQANLPWTTFDTTPQSVPTDVGTMAWDGGTTLGLQATANVLMQIGETEFVYVKASSTITKGQLCYHTGAVGSSGVTTVAPTPTNLSDPNQIVGVAAENIALNDFGLIQISGTLRGFNTTGSSVGEVWADGDPLYYNPSYVGSFTKIKPSAPKQKTYIGEVINAGSGGSGSINIRIVPGTELGGTDSNVQLTSVTDKQLIQYDSALGYWKNISTLGVSAGGTGVSSAPTDGQLLIGNGTGYTLSTLTAGANIVITNTPGGITLDATGSGGGPVGSVTSVNVSGGTTGMSFSGGPVTTIGTMTMAGTLATANGGTGQTTYTDGQLLIGNTSTGSLTKTTLTAGTGVTITNGAGSITIAAASSGGTPTLVVVTGTTQAATANNHYVLTNVAATTVTLPASPSAGDIIWITVGNGLTTNVVARNGNNIQSLAEDMTLNAAYAAVQLRYINATIGWTFV